MRALGIGASVASGLAVAIWLGGLVALGAITAPIVFTVTPMPQSADAMTMVFRRFDLVAMSCAVVVLASEAARAIGRVPFARLDHARAAVAVLAAAVTAYEGTNVSPRIADLHAAGAIRARGRCSCSWCWWCCRRSPRPYACPRCADARAGRPSHIRGARALVS
jgi:hypothetical protein